MDLMLSEETSDFSCYMVGETNTVFPKIVFQGYEVACFSLFFYCFFI